MIILKQNDIEIFLNMTTYGWSNLIVKRGKENIAIELDKNGVEKLIVELVNRLKIMK